MTHLLCLSVRPFARHCREFKYLLQILYEHSLVKCKHLTPEVNIFVYVEKKKRKTILQLQPSSKKFNSYKR